MPVRLEIRDGVAHILLDRPPLNVLGIETLRQLNGAISDAARSGVRVVLLRSALSRAFSAGVEVRDHRPERLDAMLGEVRENARLLLDIEAITVAAINGATLGGGAELALLCDYVIAADDTTFRLPEIGLGAFPPVAAVLLSERCPGPRAMSLLLGEAMDAPALERVGLVSRVVASADLAGAAMQQARQLAALSGVALRALLLATRGASRAHFLERLDAAIATYNAIVSSSSDGKEGIEAFLEKRPPVWSHH